MGISRVVGVVMEETSAGGVGGNLNGNALTRLHGPTTPRAVARAATPSKVVCLASLAEEQHFRRLRELFRNITHRFTTLDDNDESLVPTSTIRLPAIDTRSFSTWRAGT